VRYFIELASGLWTLVSGMGVTLRNLFRRPVTEQYPHEKPELSPTFRSAITLLRFDETNTHDCIACMQCVRICPSFCIHVEGTRHEGVKGKRASEFEVDYALCSLCGLCIDVCPTDTLGYSKVYDVAGYERDGFTFDLLEEFTDDEAAHIRRLQEENAAAEAKKAAAKAAAAEAKASDGGGASEGATSETRSASASKDEPST
jgi:NADH-quinone oxidoreductase subunit I